MSPDIRSTHARAAALSRSRAADDPELVATRRMLKAQRIGVLLRRELGRGLPLTGEQCADLATILVVPDGGAR